MALIKTVNGKTPHWGERCYFSENATLAGDITLGDDVSIWFGAVLRADVDAIVIGDRTNVQDGAIIHQTSGFPARLGSDVSIGHGAIVHAATIDDGALVGMNAVVLDRAHIGKCAIVAAGAVVLEGTVVGDNELWAGVPARKMKDLDPAKAREFASHYMIIKEWYKD